MSALTDDELKTLHHIEEFGLFCDYEEFEQIARAVIAANNAEVLKDLKPVEKCDILSSFEDWELYRADIKPEYYSADQFAAVVQERDAFKAMLHNLQNGAMRAVE